VQVLYFFLDKIRKLDISHAFLSLTVAKLSTLKKSGFFWPTLYYNEFTQHAVEIDASAPKQIVGGAPISYGGGGVNFSVPLRGSLPALVPSGLLDVMKIRLQRDQCHSEVRNGVFDVSAVLLRHGLETSNQSRLPASATPRCRSNLQ